MNFTRKPANRELAREWGRIIRNRSAITAAVAIALAAGVTQAATPGYTDVSTTAGLTFVNAASDDHFGGPMSGGASVLDANNDGYPDIFIVGGGFDYDALFINNQDGTFTNQSAAWGLQSIPRTRGTGSTACDYDNDGDEDIFMTTFGDITDVENQLPLPTIGKHRLYRNNLAQGQSTFTDVAVSAGVNLGNPDAPDGFGLSCGDIDMDGDLDLFMGAWFKNEDGDSMGSRLFRNNGDSTFTNITVEAGVFQTPTHGFGVVFADMNGDRFPEMLVAGDFGTNKYYLNNKDGTFTDLDIWDAQGNGKAWNGMGTTIGDFNRDGLQDWFVTAIWPTYHYENPYWGNGLYINESDNQYRVLPETAGVTDGGWGWGTAALDFDHDGWLDIAQTNGFPMDDAVTGHTFTGEQTYLFRNNGDETFSEVALLNGINHTGMGRTLIHLDYDRDGDMDIAVFANREPAQLFRNDIVSNGVTPPDANWLQVVLDTSAHEGLAPHGIGANVRIIADGQFQHMRLHGGSNYLGRSELIAHFGTGEAATVGEVHVTWPDGYATKVTGLAANQRVVVQAQPPLAVAAMVSGQPADLTVSGLKAGERAYFFYTALGEGDGPCFGFFDGMCSDLNSPRFIGSAVADASGVAVRTVTTPGNPGLQNLYIQSMTVRGDNGVASLKTNVVTAPVSAP